VKTMDFTAAGEASSLIKRRLRQLGIDHALIRRISIAAYEAEINLVIHSKGGEITFEVSPQSIQITVSDTGPGIEDIDKARRRILHRLRRGSGHGLRRGHGAFKHAAQRG
jgi:anti-sigma regulatory factor (Ser/Thr protein kinase)